jgi:hypothetical protein
MATPVRAIRIRENKINVHGEYANRHNLSISQPFDPNQEKRS